MSEIPIYKFALREGLDSSFLPTRGEPNATGWDVRAAQLDRLDVILRAGQYCKIPLGFRCIPPAGWWYELHPRSSSFWKKSLHALIGIIDQDFTFSRLETCAVFQYIPDVKSLAQDLVIKFGDPIFQIIPIRRQEMKVEQINNIEFEDHCDNNVSLRTGGFGSTG